MNAPKMFEFVHFHYNQIIDTVCLSIKCTYVHYVTKYGIAVFQKIKVERRDRCIVYKRCKKTQARFKE